MHTKLSSLAFIALLATLALCGCGGSSTSGGGGGGGNNPTTVSVTFNGTIPLAVATRIGSGSFTSASLNNNTLTISVPYGTSDFAFAYVCPQRSQFAFDTLFNDEYLVYASTSDGTSFTQSCIPSQTNSQMGTLTGTVDMSAIPNVILPTLESQYEYSDFGIVPIATAPQSFTVQVQSGSNDIMIEALDLQYDLLAANEVSDQTVPGQLNNGNTVVFGAADEITTASVTYNNTPNGSTLDVVDFLRTSSGHSFAQGLGIYVSHDFSRYSVASTALRSAGVVDAVTAYAILPQNTYTSVTQYANTGQAITINFPNVWSCPAPTTSSLPTFNLASYTGFSGQRGGYMQASLSWIPSQGYFDTLDIAAYPDAVPTSGITVPDLTQVNTSFFVPASGSGVNWTEANLLYSSGTAGDLPANSTLSTVFCFGGLTTP